MWHWIQWGWDAFWAHPVERVRDATTLVLGGLSVWLAGRAIKMGREQTKTAERQNEISERQTAIAEKQDQIMSEQLARRANIEIDLGPGVSRPDGFTEYRVLIENSGTRTLGEYTFEFACPVEILPHASIVIHDSAFDHKAVALGLNKRLVHFFNGHRRVPVFPKRMDELGLITMKSVIPNGLDVRFFWKVICEDGVFPTDGNWGETAIHYVDE